MCPCSNLVDGYAGEVKEVEETSSEKSQLSVFLLLRMNQDSSWTHRIIVPVPTSGKHFLITDF